MQLAFFFLSCHSSVFKAMVAAAHRIEVKEPDVVAENRVWSFLGEAPSCLRQTAVQVADCDWEKGLVDYDWRRGPSLAQRGQDAPFEFSQSVDRLAKLIEEAISVAGMERVGTVVVRINIGDIGPEGGYALQPLTVTVQNESFGIYGQRTHVFATTLYGRFDTEKVTLYGFFLNPRTRGTMLRREAEYLLETLISVEVRADHETDYTHFLATRAEGNYSFPLEPENEVGRTKVIDFRRLDD